MIIPTIVTLIVIALFMLSGFLVADYLLPDNFGLADRILVGVFFEFGVVVILGYIYSFAHIFTQLVASMTFLVFLVTSLTMAYKRNHLQGAKRLLLALKRDRPSQVVLVMSLVFMSLCLLFEADSPLPQGWDRAIHYTEFLDILVHGHVSDQYPGTELNNFYLQGPAFMLSFITMTVGSIAWIDPSIVLTDLTPYAIPYTIVWAFINSMWPLAGYCIGKQVTGSRQSAALTSVLMVFFAGKEISRLGSIGTSVGYLFVMVVILLFMKSETDRKRSNAVRLMSIVLVSTVALIHIIPITFLPIFVLVLYAILVIWKRPGLKRVAGMLCENIASAIMTVSVLFIFSYSLLIGIIEEITRKGVGVGGGSNLSFFEIWVAYLQNHARGLFFGLDLAIIPLALIGLVITRRWRQSPVFSVFMFFGVTFTLLPVIAFPRSIYYLMIPLAVLGAEGLHTIVTTLKNHVVEPPKRLGTKSMGIIVVALFILPTFVFQTAIAANPGPYHQTSELDESLFHPLGLATWFQNNISDEAVITFPNSGGLGRLFEILVDSQVYLADRRYSDIPPYIDIASLYDSEGLNWSEKIEIINLYQVSVIITGFSYQIANTTILSTAYPALEIYYLYDSYGIIVLYPELLI